MPEFWIWVTVQRPAGNGVAAPRQTRPGPLPSREVAEAAAEAWHAAAIEVNADAFFVVTQIALDGRPVSTRCWSPTVTEAPAPKPMLVVGGPQQLVAAQSMEETEPHFVRVCGDELERLKEQPSDA